jgi:hypothetical protein
VFKEIRMRNIATLRAASVIGVFLYSAAVVPQARAADPAPQRVAMACTHTGDGCKSPVRTTAAVEHASSRTAKAMAQRKPESQQVAQSNDGSRFLYDSCGCSND